MRYPKGTIQLGEDDLRMLRHTGSNQLVSRYQLLQMMELDWFGSLQTNGGRKHHARFNWRLRRLLDHKLVTEIAAPLPRHNRVLTLTRKGIDWLECNGEDATHWVPLSLKDINPSHLVHPIQLANIQIRFMVENILIDWISDHRLRTLFAAHAGEYTKIYDAVAVIEVEKKTKRLGIEYERVQKKATEYLKIANRILLEKQVDAILYLAPDQKLIASVARFFNAGPVPVAFCSVDDFTQFALNSVVYADHKYTQLKKLLAKTDPAGASTAADPTTPLPS